jgi:hypothetical protein
LFRQEILGLGLIMVHLYYEFSVQGKWFRVALKEVLGLGLTMVDCYHDFVSLIMTFKVA